MPMNAAMKIPKQAFARATDVQRRSCRDARDDSKLAF